MSKYIVARANLFVFAVAIVVLILVGGLTWERYDAAVMARGWAQHTDDVLAALRDLNIAVIDAETGQRGFLLTNDDDYLAPYQSALGRVSYLQGELQRLTADNPTQQERLRALAPLLQQKLQELEQTVQMSRDGYGAAAIARVRTNVGRALTKQIEAILAAITTDEKALLGKRLAAADSRGRHVMWLSGIGGILAVSMLLLAAVWLNRAWRHARQAEDSQRVLATRLHTSINSLSQGIAVFSAGRQLMHWNECFQIILKLPEDLMHAGADYGAMRDALAAAGAPVLEHVDQVRSSRTRTGEPVIFERALPDERLLEIRRTAMPDGGFVVAISDMTKRAQAEAVLRESQRMQAIGQLTGGIAHDFNNLLTIILGNLEFLRDRPADAAKVRARVERVTAAAERGAALTRQLLAFARKQPLAPAALDLSSIVPGMVPLLRRTLGEHIEVRYVETAGLWPAMADPSQLESAVLNLALNARDAMPEGGRLTIELANMVLDEEYASRHAEVAAGDYTMLAVSDTGCGMTPEVAARVFEPFFTTKADGEGTGLGLAMVFGFVKQSGGHVKVYSEPGEGTTVRIYLPRATGTAVAAGQRSVAPLELPRASATVLVVEDEAGVREVTVAMLTDLGYRVLEAADGDEGLRVFAANADEIDLVLTDVVLPGKLRGRDLAERIVALRPGVRLVYMSGYTENSIVHNGRLDDGVQLISKPFQRDQLARKLAETLRAGATSEG
jgi:signal transduction histidine kinase/CHASE3 domain sensor protein/CheY-like chemotaxis protein